MQARFAPSVAYVRDLIKQGYVGEVLSTTLVGSGMNWGPVMEQANAYTADIQNGATMLSIPVGQLVLFAIAAIIVGIVAAIFPARRAARLNVLEALQYE